MSIERKIVENYGVENRASAIAKFIVASESGHCVRCKAKLSESRVISKRSDGFYCEKCANNKQTIYRYVKTSPVDTPVRVVPRSSARIKTEAVCSWLSR